MRFITFNFTYTDTMSRVKGEGRIAAPYSFDTTLTELQLIVEDAKNKGYITDRLTNKKYRYYYCKFELVGGG
jgi:hypothetical protein